MRTAHLIKLLGCSAALAAAALSGCDNDSPVTPVPTSAVTPQVYFSQFAIQTFQASANSTPVNFDSIDLIYDVNTDPDAFNSLLM